MDDGFRTLNTTGQPSAVQGTPANRLTVPGMVVTPAQGQPSPAFNMSQGTEYNYQQGQESFKMADALKSLHNSLYTPVQGGQQPQALNMSQATEYNFQHHHEPSKMGTSLKQLQESLYAQMSGRAQTPPAQNASRSRSPSPNRTANKSANKTANKSANQTSFLNAQVGGNVSAAASSIGRIATPQSLSMLPAWGKEFRKIGTTNDMILNSGFSMTHKRFKGHNTQGGAICLLAVGMGTGLCPDMRRWTRMVLDNIIIIGDDLWHHTMVLSDNRCQRNPNPNQVFPHCYVFDAYVTIQTAPHKFTLKFTDATQPRVELRKTIEGFLADAGEDDERSGACISYQGHHVAFWRYGKFLMLFEPSDHEMDGSKWTGLAGEGCGYLKRFEALDQMVVAILDNYAIKSGTVLQLFPTYLESATEIVREPPETMPVDKPTQKLAPPLKPATSRAPQDKSAFKELSGIDQSVSMKNKTAKSTVEKSPAPPLEDQAPPEPGISPSKERVPKEPARIKSEIYFVDFQDGALGVLSSTTHQRDPKFTRMRTGDQAIPNTTAALCMLKVHKAKHWVRKVLDEVLRGGERTFWSSRDTGELKKVIVEEKAFTVELTKFEAMGKLQSENPRAVLDLEVCVRDFLNEHTGAILIGPIIVALWFEDGIYYLFDPDPRMSNGARPPYEKLQPPPEMDEHFNGKAVVLRFRRLKDLVENYMTNLPNEHARDHFYLVKVDIEPYEDPLDNWNAFTRTNAEKWILSGTFSQRDSRFDHPGRNNQCTAMAAMAYGYRHVEPMEKWTRDTVDAVLVHGDDFYQQCVEALTSAGNFQNPQLMAGELNRVYRLEEKEIDFEVDDCLINGVWDASSDENITNLRKGLDEFFALSDGGLLTACGQSFGVWRMDDAFFYFDSHMRNAQGIATRHGTACVQRITNTRTLSEAVRTNLLPNGNREYNLSRLEVKVFDLGDGGLTKVPLKHFMALNDNVAILRGNTHHKDWDKWFINAGKIHVNCCVVAMAFDKVEPVMLWGKPEMDKIMTLGNQHYKLSKKELYDNLEEKDEIDQDNIRKDILVGINKLDYANIENQTVTGLEELKEALGALLDPTNEAYQARAETNPDEPQPCILLTTEMMCKGIWSDDKAIYVFDPAPRDERGDIISRDDWTILPEPEPEPEPAPEVDPNALPDPNALSEDGDAGAAGEPSPSLDENVAELPAEGGVGGEGGEGGEGGGFPDGEEPPPLKEKRTDSFWVGQEKELGKACVLRLARFEDLLEHLTQNTPPTKKDEMGFTISNIRFDNATLTADVFDPEQMEKELPNQGDWYHFIEVDYLKWALRGTRNMDDELYPEPNRGKQAVAMCLVALGEARLYSMDKFEPWVVDEIGIYGDRLFTGIKKITKQLMKTKATPSQNMSAFPDDVLDQLVHMFVYTPEHFITPEKSFLIKETKIHQEIHDKITGHLKVADDVEHTLNLKGALRKMFDTGLSEMCVVEAKGVSVAVWRSQGYYYMYDPYVRSPNGAKASVGFPCITRFSGLGLLVERYESNLPKDKPADFRVWPVVCSTKAAERPRAPEPQTPQRPVSPPPKLGGFSPVVPGKEILRSAEKLDYTKFDRGIHKHSTAIAVVALATSLFIKPETWTQLIVDDVLKHGEVLYNQSVQTLGERFNQWAERLDLHRVLHDFNYGNLKVNFEIRFRDERGVIYDKGNAHLQNLRQGLEKFFLKNVYGVLVIGDMAFAIWEEDREDSFIEEVTTHLYLYDPNTRGATGLPMLGGTACLMKFLNSTMAADHVKSCLPPNEWNKLLYIIHPLEFLIGQQPGRKRRHKHRVYRHGVTQMGELTAKTVPGYSPKGQSPKTALQSPKAASPKGDGPSFKFEGPTDPSIYMSPPRAAKGSPSFEQSRQQNMTQSFLKVPGQKPSTDFAGAGNEETLYQRLNKSGEGGSIRTAKLDASGYQRVPSPKPNWSLSPRNANASMMAAGPMASSRIENLNSTKLHWPSSPREPFGGIFSGVSPIKAGQASVRESLTSKPPAAPSLQEQQSLISGVPKGPRPPPQRPIAGNVDLDDAIGTPTDGDFKSLGGMSSSPKSLGGGSTKKRVMYKEGANKQSLKQSMGLFTTPGKRDGGTPCQREASIQEKMIRSIAEASRSSKSHKAVANFARNKFEKVTDDMYILRSREIPLRDRELSYCYIWRIAIAQEPNIGKWTRANIDQILNAGKQLYIDYQVMQHVKLCGQMAYSDIPRDFYSNEQRYTMQVEKPVDTGATLGPEGVEDVLTRFFRGQWRYTILIFDDLLFPVAFQGGYYYLFDFYPCDHRGQFTGQPGPEHTSVVLRFDELSRLGARLNALYVNETNSDATFFLMNFGLVAADNDLMASYIKDGGSLLRHQAEARERSRQEASQNGSQRGSQRESPQKPPQNQDFGSFKSFNYSDNSPTQNTSQRRPSQSGSQRRPSQSGSQRRPSQSESQRRPSQSGSQRRASQSPSERRAQQNASQRQAPQNASQGQAPQNASQRLSQNGSQRESSQSGSQRPQQNQQDLGFKTMNSTGPSF